MIINNFGNHVPRQTRPSLPMNRRLTQSTTIVCTSVKPLWRFKHKSTLQTRKTERVDMRVSIRAARAAPPTGGVIISHPQPERSRSDCGIVFNREETPAFKNPQNPPPRRSFFFSFFFWSSLVLHGASFLRLCLLLLGFS